MPPLKICLVAAEIAPFAKTGGLADVCAALPRALHKAGHDLKVFLPMYERVRGGGRVFAPVSALQDVPLQLGGRRLTFSVSTAPLPKSKALVHFVRCPELYDRKEIYTSDGDEHLRFALLSRAALASCQWLQWAPDVVHCNDWHTALLPLYLKTLYAWDKLFAGTKTLLTIHNIAYQGTFSAEIIDGLGLGEARQFFYQEDLQNNRVNFLKTGLLYADLLTTVSRTYAQEVQTAEHGHGLHELLRARAESFTGIVNGVDYDEWNPEKDPLIPHPYSARELKGKEKNKQALLERFKLPYEPLSPLLGVVSRLVWQKGLELLPDTLTVLLRNENLRLVVLGSGEEKYEQYFRWLQGQHPGKVAFHNGYDDALAHQIEAGSDLFLMPSRYEPCGLNQMYSLRYGTIPVVRRTGGLADTVQHYDPASGQGTGFLFDDFSSEALYSVVQQALRAWRNPTARARLIHNGMAQDYSWDHQAREYIQLYRKLAGAVPAPS